MRQGDQSTRPVTKWIAAFAAAVLVHLVFLCMIPLQKPGATDKAPEIRPVSLVHVREKAGAVPADSEKPTAARQTASSGTLKKTLTSSAGKRIVRKTEAAAPAEVEDAVAEAEQPAEKPVSIWPSESLLSEIAMEDARIKRKKGKDTVTHGRNTRVKNYGLPEKISTDFMRQTLDIQWEPGYDELKDSSMSEVSGKWFARLLRDWYTTWKKDVDSMNANPSAIPELRGFDEDDPFSFSLEDQQTSFGHSVSATLEFEPLLDGKWAVSMRSPSGHAFWDTVLLEDAALASEHFPSWPDGYGWSLRFSFEAKYSIVPPVPAIGLAWNQDFTEWDLIYPFKKSVRKSIRFEGAEHAVALKTPSGTEEALSEGP